MKIRRLLAGAVAIAALGFPVQGMAAEVLKEDAPLKLVLQTSLDAETARYGDSFEAVLADDHHYNQRALPAGTRLKGHVKSAAKSYSLGFPGYVSLEIKELVLPDGSVATLKAIEPDKIRHAEAKTHFKLLKAGLPFSAVSAADGVPLKYAAGLSTWEILPISLAARMVMGVAMESLEKERNRHARKNHPLPTRVGHGLLRGTGLTGAYYLLSPSPEPSLAQGEVIPLHLNPSELDALFTHGTPLAQEAVQPEE